MNELTRTRINETSTEWLDYLEALVDIQTNRQIGLDTINELRRMDKDASVIRSEPQKQKILISWKVVIGLFILGLCATMIVEFLGVLCIVLPGIYIFSRYSQSSGAYNKLKSEWDNEYAYKNRIRENVSVQTQDITDLIRNCDETLNQLFAVGPLDKDYRNLAACATFYDWFRKGMTRTLQRTDTDPGAYVMYLDELRHKELKADLNEIKTDVKSIKATQERLYNAVVEIQQTVNTISKQLADIGQKLDYMSLLQAVQTDQLNKIADNTAVGAFYAKTAADNTSAMNRFLGV